MKKMLWISLVVATFMLLAPISVISNTQATNTIPVANNKVETKEKNDDVFRLYNPQTEKVSVISADEYIFGVVSAEMPALYENQALKAQAVAAYTYACYYRELNKNESYDLSTDPSVSQCYITKADAQAKWGSKADEYTEKIENVIADTKNYVIEYKGDIILAVYHAISAGKTEKCSNVWGKDYPYLQAVDSEYDKEAENYKVEVSFTVDEIKNKLKELKLSENPAEYFGESILTDSGYVNEIKVCGNSCSGSKIRSLLDLRSTCFSVAYTDDKFTFTTYGYGHGVGMSQNGANALAKEGKNFKEILEHYYTGCIVTKR